jgi:DNA-damage-inducible protein J
MKRQTSIRVEDRFYKESEKVFDVLGLSFGDAVNLFLAKV